MNLDLSIQVSIYIFMTAATLVIGTFKKVSIISWLLSILAPLILFYIFSFDNTLLSEISISEYQKNLVSCLCIFTLVLNGLSYSDKIEEIIKLVIKMIMLLSSVVCIISQDFITYVVGIEILILSIYSLALTTDSIKSPIYIIRAYLQSTLITIITVLGVSFYLLATKDLSIDNVIVENQELLAISISIFSIVSLMRLLIFPLQTWITQTLPLVKSKDIIAVVCLGIAPIAISNLLYLNSLISFLDPKYQEVLISVIKVFVLISSFIASLLSLKSKRAHTKIGYILLTQMPLIVLTIGTIQGEAVISHIVSYVFILFLSYAFASLMISTIQRKDSKNLFISDLLGLAKTDISRAILITISICSIIGLPLTAGFLIKLAVIKELIQIGELYSVLVFLISFSLSAYSAMNIIFKMFIPKDECSYDIEIIGNNFRLSLLKYLIALSVIIGGIVPALI